MPRAPMVISRRWLQVAIFTFVVGFAVLGFLAFSVSKRHPPIPQRVVGADGQVLFTGPDVMAGQHLFERFGLMQFGTIFGHGAYLGPDFTADYLHRAALAMLDHYRRAGQSEAEAGGSVRADWQTNRYDAATGTLLLTPAGAAAFRELEKYYAGYFGTPLTQRGLQRPAILDPKDIHELTSFFAWSAWAAATPRPDALYSYTNGWPDEPLVGNKPTADAYLWSALSLVALLGGTGILFFLFGRYDLLGWHREEERPHALEFRQPREVRLTPAQRAVAWYYLVVAGLFLAQGLLGGVNAHYHVEPSGFYGLNLATAFPYNLTRTWHVQLALFFVAASFLAMGIFIAPMIARREPKGQRALALTLFAALVFVVVGSLVGEALSYHGFFSGSGPWWWLGAQGWEYLDLGRLWQILLTVGMVLWLVHRGARPVAAPAGGAPGQPAVAVHLLDPVHPAVLCRGPGVHQNDQFHRRRFLALLGGAPVGGGFPGAVYHHHGGLHLRAAGRGPYPDGHAGGLPGCDHLLHRRGDRHHASSLLLGRAGRAHGPGGVLLGHGGHPAAAADL